MKYLSNLIKKVSAAPTIFLSALALTGLIFSANAKAECVANDVKIQRTIKGHFYSGSWARFTTEPLRNLNLYNSGSFDNKCDIIIERVESSSPDRIVFLASVGFRRTNNSYYTGAWSGGTLNVSSVAEIVSMGLPNFEFHVGNPTKTEWNNEPFIRILRSSDRAVMYTVYFTGKLDAFPADIVSFNQSVALKPVHGQAFSGINQPATSHAQSMGIKVTTNNTQNAYIDFTSASLTSDGAFILPSKGRETGVAVCVFDQSTSQCVRPAQKFRLDRGLNQFTLPYSLTYVKTRETVEAGDISGTLTVRLYTD